MDRERLFSRWSMAMTLAPHSRQRTFAPSAPRRTHDGWRLHAAAILAGLFVVRTAWGTGEVERLWVIELGAQVSTAPAAVTLNWPSNGSASSFAVYRRASGGFASSWGAALTNLPGAATGYTDTAVGGGAVLDYAVAASPSGKEGFIRVGIEAPPVEDRGKAILLVESNAAAALPLHVERLQRDMVSDGWTVLRRDVARTEAVTNVKAIVKAAYDADTNGVRSLFVLGHVPIPYSGMYSPDGHGARAFPTDLYYAEIYGTTWTDSTVSNTTWGDASNWNVPGDGTFDQDAVATLPELEVGRVDFYGMPSFAPLTEYDLLRRYLDKDHAFRCGQVTMPRRGLVYDSWTLGSARDAWRNFAPLVGASNVVGQWWWAMQDDAAAALWAYSCGYGQTEAGDPPFYASHPLKTVFTARFGSYSGDWDDPDNQLRCVIATTPSALSCSWSGCSPPTWPKWHFFPMGAGATLGYCGRYTHANGSPNVYTELLGDPTLRMHPVGPPGLATSETPGGGAATVRWRASTDTVPGYYVYRAAGATGPYTRVSGSLVTGTNFTDASALPGTSYYMVRAVKREVTPSGTYTNLSQGVLVRHPDNTVLTVVSVHGAPQPAAGTHAYAYGDLVACAAPATVTGGGTQYVCSGWSGSGTLPASGSPANAPTVLLTAPSTLAWNWNTNYWLALSSGAGGHVTTTSDWHAANATVQIQAVADDARMRFRQWSGAGLPPGSETQNPLDLVMNRAYAIAAEFELTPGGTQAPLFVASFEEYAPGTSLPGLDGWTGIGTNAGLVSTDAAAQSQIAGYTPACGLPLATNHTRFADTGSGLEHACESPTSTVIWADAMLRFQPPEEDGPPAAPAGSLWALAMRRSDGRLLFWHGHLASGSNGWSALDRTVRTDQWVRVTMTADFRRRDPAHPLPFCQLDLDGQQVAHALAYTANDGSGATGGTWFAAAADSSRLSAVGSAGRGLMDDVVIGVRDPGARLAPLGTPSWWLWQYGLTNGTAADEELLDRDNDGFEAWEEFVANTDPGDPGSTFRFTDAARDPSGRLALHFASRTNRMYSLDSSATPGSAGWQPTPFALTPSGTANATSTPGAAPGGTTTIYVPASATGIFYRLRVYR
jgi:hypothetical protein